MIIDEDDGIAQNKRSHGQSMLLTKDIVVENSGDWNASSKEILSSVTIGMQNKPGGQSYNRVLRSS